MRSSTEIRLYSGTANPELSEAIAKHLHVELGHATIQRFPDGEIFVQYTDNLRNADMYIVQPTCCPANENLMELLIMIDAAKRASAARITAVLPYYGYARQDRKDRPRVPITAKLVANLLTKAGANRVLAMDLHCQQIQGFFDIPVDHVYASPILIKYLRTQAHVGPDSVVVSPDSGSVKMAHSFADKLNCGFAVVAKRRVDATTVESSHLVGDIKGRNCIITDDMTSTAGTLCGAAELLKREGAKKIYAVVSHSLLNEKGMEKLNNSPIEELITTNTVPQAVSGPKLKVLCTAPMFAEAIRRIHQSESISCLFRDDSMTDNLL
ncbi:MAG: ribose-phosphate pyrophosphokinase [Lentisphaeria bacterium]|nr:ribose-phosphate pyrophosphokinase [Lentisphaeria bacterium]